MGDRFREGLKVDPNDLNDLKVPSFVGKKVAPKSYKAPKGTANKANKSKKLSAKTLSMLLAAAIGVVGMTAHTLSKEPEEIPSITDVKEDGVNAKTLGLSEETYDHLIECEDFFADIKENENYNLTDTDIVNMINRVEGLHFSVVKEKMGNLLGESVDNIKMYYGLIDAMPGAWLEVGNDKYSSSTTPFKLGDKNTIPYQIRDTIWELETLQQLQENLEEDKVTKINAVKKLEEIFNNLVKITTSKFTQDKNGNISILHKEQGNTVYDIDGR